ncbi:TerD family protein [Streptomyces hoynatensis]|uniref:TerD family protein n=1 Tax=Streptomyces hoynatensis TaxID=1141874 RepID=A0A3A9ZCA7_9ACTN|nr:TerD family protein [Streptomyces hoynatensis]RKN44967.1 TerD family protein [Streptomyces hoynatensis]
MSELPKGANAPVPGGPLHVAVDWQAGPGVPDVDVSALLLGASGRVRGDADFVFFNQREHPSGAVRHLGKSGGEAGAPTSDWLWADLAGVEAAVDRIVVAASADGGTFGQIPGLAVRVGTVDGVQVARFAIGDATTETAFLFGEFYRRGGGWKFRAIGQGYDSGLAGLARDFGVAVDEPAPGPTAPAAPPRPAGPGPAAPYPPPPAAPPAFPQPGPHPQGAPWAPAVPGAAPGLPPQAPAWPAPAPVPVSALAPGLEDLAAGFAPHVHQGRGNQRFTCPPGLPPGHWVMVEVACRGSISVAVHTCDAYGRTDEEVLVTYADEVHASGLATVPADRPLSLRVEADTPWTARVLPVGRARRLTHALDGAGPELLVYEGPGGVLSFQHRGESNVTLHHIVKSTDPDWPHDEQELLVNEIGHLDVLAPVPGPGLLRVETDGPWRLSVGG